MSPRVVRLRKASSICVRVVSTFRAHAARRAVSARDERNKEMDTRSVLFPAIHIPPQRKRKRKPANKKSPCWYVRFLSTTKKFFFRLTGSTLPMPASRKPVTVSYSIARKSSPGQVSVRVRVLAARPAAPAPQNGMALHTTMDCTSSPMMPTSTESDLAANRRGISKQQQSRRTSTHTHTDTE